VGDKFNPAFFNILIYIFAIGFYLKAIKIPNPWFNAIVPAVAFLLSTLTLPFFKELWVKYVYKKAKKK
jgi:hypothetical protein